MGGVRRSARVGRAALLVLAAAPLAGCMCSGFPPRPPWFGLTKYGREVRAERVEAERAEMERTKAEGKATPKRR